MARNNIKLLTNSQRVALNDKYIFEHKDNMILVKLHDYGRITAHPDDKPFSINSSIRKITFSIDAINIWKELYKDPKTRESLVNVQHAVNELYVTYQPVDISSVKKFMKDSIKVKKI